MGRKTKLLQKMSLVAIQGKCAQHHKSLALMNFNSIMMPTMLANISNSFIGWYYQMPKDIAGYNEEISHRTPHDVGNISEPNHFFHPHSYTTPQDTDLPFPEISDVHPGGFEEPTGGGGYFVKDPSLSFNAQNLTGSGAQHGQSPFAPHGGYSSHGGGYWFFRRRRFWWRQGVFRRWCI